MLAISNWILLFLRVLVNIIWDFEGAKLRSLTHVCPALTELRNVVYVLPLSAELSRYCANPSHNSIVSLRHLLFNSLSHSSRLPARRVGNTRRDMLISSLGSCSATLLGRGTTLSPRPSFEISPHTRYETRKWKTVDATDDCTGPNRLRGNNTN